MTLCKKCNAKCCKYFALQIDTPKSKIDFENIRWYIAHKKVSIFIEKRKWYLQISNKCEYLLGNNKCSIYDKRPIICKEHETSVCEYDSKDFEYDIIFNNLDEFDLYLSNRFNKEKK